MNVKIKGLLLVIKNVFIAVAGLVYHQLALRAGAGDVLRAGEGEGSFPDVVSKGLRRHRVLLGPAVLVPEDVVPVIVDSGDNTITDEIDFEHVDVVVLEVVQSLLNQRTDSEKVKGK